MRTLSLSLKDSCAPALRRYPLAIIGAGALGLSFAARLAASMQVAVVARSAARAGQLRAGVMVGDARFQADAHAPDALPEADWVIVLVKAADTADAGRLAAAMRPLGVLSAERAHQQALRDAVHAPGPARTAAAGEQASPPKVPSATATASPSGAGDAAAGFETIAALFRAPGSAPASGHRPRAKPSWVNLAINPLAALFRARRCEPPYRVHLDALAQAWPVLRAPRLALTGRRHARVVAVAGPPAPRQHAGRIAGRRTEINHHRRLPRWRPATAPGPTHHAVFPPGEQMEAG